MNNKKLYRSLDDQFERVYSKNTSENTAEKPKHKLNSRLNSIKEYFFPRDEFEEVLPESESSTVVKKIDRGFKCDIKRLLAYIKFKKKEKVKPKPEDVDLSLVKEVIRKNKNLK